MKPFLLLLASAIALGIYAQAAVDQDALRAELDAAYEAFEEAALVPNKELAEQLARTTLRLGEQLFGPNHPNTAKGTYNLAYAMRPDYWMEVSPAGLALAELAIKKHEVAFGADSEETLPAIILAIQFLAYRVNAVPFGKRREDPQLLALIERAQAIGKASDNAATLPTLYGQLSKLGTAVGNSKQLAADAVRLFTEAYGPRDPRTLIARMDAEIFLKGRTLSFQAYAYERILDDAKDVEEFDDYRFALHRTLALWYLRLADNSKATEHLQAAGRLNTTASNSEYRPLYTIPPVYPRKASLRGIQGYVLLEFTVTRKGTVHSVKVIESDPPGWFDRASMKAAQQFRYLPKYVDGEPIEVQGLSRRIQFELID